MQQRRSAINLKTMVLVGVLAALVLALSLIEIRIPLPAFGDKTRLHLGNVMCLVSGVLFGPMVGGLSAGFGSMLYDFTHPEYFAESWITFLTKFAMGFVAGLIARYPLSRLAALPKAALAGLAGQATYIALYLAKTALMQHYIYGLAWAGTWPLLVSKGTVSAVNGLIAVVGCAILAPALQKALASSGLFTPKPPHRTAS